jgi:hypothetical protein
VGSSVNSEGTKRAHRGSRALDPTRDPRDFRAEAAEELRDALVYLGAELVRLANGEK